MKHVIYGVSMAALSILLLAVVMTISGKNVRSNEIRQALGISAEQAVDSLRDGLESMDGTTGAEEGKAELLADFAERLALKLKSDGTLGIYVGKADAEQGMLCVRAEELFRHPNGQPGMVRAEQTVLREQYPLPQKKACSIYYWIGDELYKCYVLQEGSKLVIPQKPEGGFRFWADEAGVRLPEGSVFVTKDKTYHAVLNR